MSLKLLTPYLLASCALFALGTLTTVPRSLAQAPDPAPPSKIEELKAQYAAEVVAAERDLKEKYIAALERVQQNLQAQAKLEDALAVKREREKIEAELASSGTKPSVPGTPGTNPNTPSGASEFTLKSSEATPLGDVEYVEKWGALTSWRNQDSGAEWDLPSVPQGVYSISFDYACPVEGGTLTFQLGSATFPFAVPPTGSWAKYGSVSPGQVVVGPTPSTLRILVADDAGSPFGLLNLRSVSLKKIGG